jgi:hypothetical protein
LPLSPIANREILTHASVHLRFIHPASTYNWHEMQRRTKTPAVWLLSVMAIAPAEYKKGCKRVLAALQQLFAFFSVFFSKQRGCLRQTPSFAIRLSAYMFVV